MSLRRSSRTRPSTSSRNSIPHNSSFPGVSRPDRTTRSDQDTLTPEKNGELSRSDEDYDDEISTPTRRNELRRSRLSKSIPTSRECETEPETESKSAVHENVEREDQFEEEETTRCVCENLEYPGSSSPVNGGPSGSRPHRTRAPSNGNHISYQDPSPRAENPNEDSGSLFIQCDECKVWQHGMCVGITHEESSPDEYFCEECRPQLHRIEKASNGRKYSQYQPLLEPKTTPKSRKYSSPVASTTNWDGDRGLSVKTSPTASEPLLRRRSTMNSRNAQESDSLRKLIDENKGEASSANNNLEREKRRSKRVPEACEEIAKPSTKRTRTTSFSTGNSTSYECTPIKVAESDQETPRHAKSVRSAISRSQRDKESKDTETPCPGPGFGGHGRSESRKSKVDSSPPLMSSKVTPLSTLNSTPSGNDLGPELQGCEGYPTGPESPCAITSPSLKGAARSSRRKVGRNSGYSRGFSSSKSQNRDPKEPDSEESGIGNKAELNAAEGENSAAPPAGTESMIEDSRNSSISRNSTASSNSTNSNISSKCSTPLDIRTNQSNITAEKNNRTQANKHSDRNVFDSRLRGEKDAPAGIKSPGQNGRGEDGPRRSNRVSNGSPIGDSKSDRPVKNAGKCQLDVESVKETCIPGTDQGMESANPTAPVTIGSNVRNNSNSQTALGSGNRGIGRRKGREKNGLTDLKKRAALMLDYISRVQVELALRPCSDGEGSSRRPIDGRYPHEDLDKIKPTQKGWNEDGEASGKASCAARQDDENHKGGLMVASEDTLKDFARFDTTVMMDLLTRKLVLWQQEFGKFGER